ncbi:MAG: hypothetical protein ACI4IL_06520 [Eubacterium sp.]
MRNKKLIWFILSIALLITIITYVFVLNTNNRNNDIIGPGNLTIIDVQVSKINSSNEFEAIVVEDYADFQTEDKVIVTYTNQSLENMLENDINIGDRVRVGISNYEAYEGVYYIDACLVTY